MQCADGTLYTGITTDLDRRLREHNENDKGAKYTRARRPVSCVYNEQVESRSTAAKREYQIRQLSRQQKLALIANNLSTSI